MKSYPADTNASAVILYDKGESFIDDNMDIDFKRHLRVKILNTKGYEWGSHTVDLYTGSYIERIVNIEAATYWIENNGQIKSSSLNSKDIFMEKTSDNITRCKFTLPALKPGCVIEIRYNVISPEMINVRGWTFQHSEPVVWSEYVLRSPKSIAFSWVTQGYEQFKIQDEQDATQVFSGTAASYFSSSVVKCNQYRWVLANAPAMREEPYITTIEDYRNKVDVQLMGYAYNGIIKKFLNNWDKFISDLLDSKYFGNKIEETSKAKKIVNSIITNLSSREEKMQAIYNWVSNSIVWDGKKISDANQDIDDVIDSKKGNSAEITFLFLSMLKCAGINGDPVILSTRDNGRVQSLYPIISQFDYVIARVKLDSVLYFIDATDPLRPIDLLPTKVLNVKGLVIQKGSVEWVTLTSNKKSHNVAIANIELKQDGSFNGNIEDFYKDYGALNSRRKIKGKSGIEFAKESFDANKTGISVDSVSVLGRDTINIPFSIKTFVSSSNYGQCNNDIIYLNPQLINRIWENPFKTQNRKFPVDFSYGRSMETIINITLPDSFEVKEQLENRNLSICANELNYFRYFSVVDNRVQLRTKMEIKKSIISPEFYSQLREFYEKIVACGQEQIVLSRIKKAPEAAIEQNSKTDPASVPEANTEPVKQKKGKK